MITSLRSTWLICHTLIAIDPDSNPTRFLLLENFNKIKTNESIFKLQSEVAHNFPRSTASSIRFRLSLERGSIEHLNGVLWLFSMESISAVFSEVAPLTL